MPIRALLMIAALGLGATLSQSDANAEAVAGRDYTALQPAQRTDSPGKVEVIEFFSYGCPHCADLHSKVTAWQKALPKDAVFKRVPVGFGRPAWDNLARAYYALEATGDLAKLDGLLYEAIHKQGQSLVDGASLTAWVGRNGGDAARFTAAFNSFSVSTKAARAQELTKSYRITAVPTFTVDGRYSVIGHSEDQMLSTAAELIGKARAESQRNASR